MNPSKEDLLDLIKTCTPVGDWLIVVPEEKEKITRSGIARAQTAKGEDETQIGLVVAVGEGYHTEYGEFIPTTSKKGERVLIDKFAGVTVRVDRKGKVLGQHEDITDDRLPVRILRQASILWTFPTTWPQ